MHTRRNNRFILIISFIFLALLIINMINISLDSDEQFTIGLVHNTYSNIINFDSLDVHPPFYYLFLKLFLQVTTFWTSSIFVKIIFSRILSLFIGIICVYVEWKLLRFINDNLKVSFIPICIIFISIPSILMYSQYIRMYMLAAMFIFIELYELIKYIKLNKNIDLIIAVVMGSLAAYTHYFAAISAGLFLLYFFIRFICQRNYKQSFKLGLSGIIYLIFYIPWIIIAKKQFSMATSSQYNTNQIYTKSTYTIHNFVNLAKQSLFSLVGGQGTYGNKIGKVLSIFLLILFAYFVYWSFKNLNNKFNSLLTISGINLVGTILVGLLVSIIKHPILIDHYLFPSFAIFAFLMSYVIYQYIKQTFHNDKLHMGVSLLIILALFINVSLYTGHSAKNLIKSHAIVTEMNTWHHSNNHDIYMKNTKTNIWNIADNSIYLRSMHKDVRTNSFKNTDQMFGKPDVRLMHGVYPNVKD